MDAPIAGYIIAGCLLLGSLTGAAEQAGDYFYYENFLNDPDNYYLVDDFGNPVSQDLK